MKKITSLILLIIGILIIYAADIPIIYINGFKGTASCSDGWDTFGKHDSTSYNKIDFHKYGGYEAYSENCYRYTTLPSGINKKTMFNFTYYLEIENHGVFSISKESVNVGYKTLTYFSLGIRITKTLMFPPFAKHPNFSYDSIVEMPRYIYGLIRKRYKYYGEEYEG